ncbi:hypothetical protein [Agromyces sp. NPDC058104]|uniref:hypothetical protein n=1 Tax=Agromyces sp. NPDC058104 TaxID=3346342 RepID=UPI0036D89CE5
MSGTPDRYSRNVRVAFKPTARSTAQEACAVAFVSIVSGSFGAAVISGGELALTGVPEYLVGALASGLIYWLLALRFPRGELWAALAQAVAASLIAATLMAIWVVIQTQGSVQTIVIGFLLYWVMYGMPFGAAVGALGVRLILARRRRQSDAYQVESSNAVASSTGGDSPEK